MIFNDEEIELEKVEARYIIRKNSRSTYIEIHSKDGNSIVFSFKRGEFDPKLLDKNKVIDLRKYIYWDVTLVTSETYYLFDLTKDKIDLIRLDDNIFNIKVNIENPDMIFSPLHENATFKNLIIDTNFSFLYEDDIINKGVE